jgi:hypothetical protein
MKCQLILLHESEQGILIQFQTQSEPGILLAHSKATINQYQVSSPRFQSPVRTRYFRPFQSHHESEPGVLTQFKAQSEPGILGQSKATVSQNQVSSSNSKPIQNRVS